MNLLAVLTEATSQRGWFDLIYENPSVLFYILGGVGAIVTMIIGVLLIRRRTKVKIVEVNKPNKKEATNKKQK